MYQQFTVKTTIFIAISIPFYNSAPVKSVYLWKIQKPFDYLMIVPTILWPKIIYTTSYSSKGTYVQLNKKKSWIELH